MTNHLNWDSIEPVTKQDSWPNTVHGEIKIATLPAPGSRANLCARKVSPQVRFQVRYLPLASSERICLSARSTFISL